jgi:hypothetical protein
MISATNIERQYDLDFPITKVKNDIERVVKPGGYVLDNKNDLLNTFRINKMTGLEFMSMNVTLKVLDENKTQIHINVTEKLRSDGHKLIVDKMIDAFLERLTKALTGATEEELRKVSESNKGCFVLFFVLIGSALALSLLA